MTVVQVFIVDDSAVVRQTLTHLLQGDPEVALQGFAPNPLIAAPMLRRHRPDVLLLDIEMPGMDGLTFLRQLMTESPIPTVICSTLTTHGSQLALEALSAGAVAVVAKPRMGLKQFLEDSRCELLAALKTAARARPQPRGISRMVAAGGQSFTAAPSGQRTTSVNKPVVIGSSTGGTQAIEQILLALPADAPGIAIVQHMPEKFTGMYAKRLNSLCQMQVREAVHGDRMERGLALIAPGGRHMSMRKAGDDYFVMVADGPPVNRHKPSVNVLFRSVAACAGSDTLAIILTGMGDDGALGMERIHEAGGRTIAQDEASCVVFGMPKEAIQLGIVDDVLPLERITQAILRFDALG
jgi:two-component system chemotaxis response regulator CheB